MDNKALAIIRKHALLNALNFGKADPGRMFGRVIGEMPEIKNDMNALKKAINETVNEVNKLSKDKVEAELKKDYPEMLEKKEVEKKELHELKGIVKGKQVVMRFAPSPSGPLHIGHSYVLGLNSEYCRLYKGKLILRIEDTNPANIDPYAYTQIPEDAKWLTKGNVSEVVIQSDNIENYYDHALKMIEKGFVYVCTCAAEEFKKTSSKKEECPCRNNKVAENLKRWKMMFDPDEYEEGDAVLRFKTDMAHKNPAMRDFPLMRINDEEHPKTGKEYRVWPLMNFSVACDDHDYGVTHCLRGKDHADNAKRQEYMQRAMGWPVPETLFVGRINFNGMSVSCSETKQLIKEGK
ncbi:MAG: glutamate--tRNA ligase family protein, partial [Candidatus Woesearchaeota archaeon]|nr:glutamate--tRNA ligase family protein [Candidatus Woesearchaeota archaeon]